MASTPKSLHKTMGVLTPAQINKEISKETLCRPTTEV